MDTMIQYFMSVGILIAAIDTPESTPATTAIKTLDEDEITWEDVSSRLVEEHRSISKSCREAQDRENAGFS